MIDFHTHILPNIDDGSKSTEMSLEMLNILSRQGVDTVVATPHFSALKESPEEFLARRQVAMDAIPREEGQPRILPGAEVAYFMGMSHCEALRQLTIGQSGLLLVEMPFGAWSERMVEDVCALQRQLDIMPVLAHVERYDRKDQFSRYQDALWGQVLIQCNAEFFLRKGFGKPKAIRMLQDGQIQFVGSDCHNLEHRAPNMDQAMKVIRKKLGEDAVQALDDMMREYVFGEGAM